MLIPDIEQNTSHFESGNLLVALIVAAVLHAVLIYGISFGGFKAPEDNKIIPRMEVTLVNTHSDNVPDNVDYLAQANQEGGGNVKEKVRPETSIAPLIPIEAIDIASPSPPQREAAESKRDIRNTLLTHQSGKESVFADETPEDSSDSKKLDIAALMIQAKDIATLDADLGKKNQQFAKKPRRKFISAATKEYKYATYMESWRKKVEKVGNLNFPQEAKARNLAGSLILDIAINVDGTIRSFKIARSSGYKILDDAALNIVYLAAPFAPLPPSIRKETDVLHITRTWKFLDGDRLTTR